MIRLSIRHLIRHLIRLLIRLLIRVYVVRWQWLVGFLAGLIRVISGYFIFPAFITAN